MSDSDNIMFLQAWQPDISQRSEDCLLR